MTRVRWRNLFSLNFGMREFDMTIIIAAAVAQTSGSEARLPRHTWTLLCHGFINSTYLHESIHVIRSSYDRWLFAPDCTGTRPYTRSWAPHDQQLLHARFRWSPSEYQKDTLRSQTIVLTWSFVIVADIWLQGPWLTPFLHGSHPPTANEDMKNLSRKCILDTFFYSLL